MENLSTIFSNELFISAIRLSTPITLAAIGATICERTGVVNIAMEGLMLIGAFVAVWLTHISGNPWIGLVGAVIAGGIFSLIHAVATVNLHLNHVVSGAVLNILALGLAQYLLVLAFGHPGSSDPLPVSLADFRWEIPLLGKIPLLGPVFFRQTPVVYLSFLLVPLSFVFLNKTKTGLHIRAAGEHPLALETLGISVYKIRYLGIIISGMLSGLAGAFLAIENTNTFNCGMVGGRGFIALAAMIFGNWNPVRASGAALFFGFTDAVQYRFQLIQGLNIPAEVFIMLPYIATIIAVAGLVRKSRPPQSIGQDFMLEKD